MKQILNMVKVALGCAVFLSSCSTYIEFTTQKSAEPRYTGMEKVGVNSVVFGDRNAVELSDNLGSWRAKGKKLDDSHVETLVRKSLVTNLRRFSDYQVFDLQNFRKFHTDFQRLRPVSGEKVGDLDFIIDVRISYDAITQSGRSQEVKTFRQQATAKRGNKWVTTQDSSQQKVVTMPYHHSGVDFICFVEVIKTKGGETKVLKSFNTIVSYQSGELKTVEAMVNEVGVVITSQVLKNVSKYSVLTRREIDKGSDGEIVDLMENADLEKARRKLESIVSSDDKKPADIYNLGICYEALGDAGVALQMYRDAHQLDEDEELYMIAIGDIE